MPVQQALDELGRIYGTKFVYESALISGRTTTVRVVPGRSVADLLKAILYPNGLLFLYVDPTHYTIVAKDQAQTTAPAGGSTPEGLQQADTRTISGIVQDEQGQPLPGATVLAGTSGAVGGATNAAGRFLLRISASALGARVSSIGYEDQAFVLGAQSYYTITLRTQAVGLKPVEVVSTGYESLPRERATGSFGLVTSEQLEQIPVPNVVQRLEGQVAGVQLNIQESDNSFLYQNNIINPNANNVGVNSYGLTVRGASTLNTGVDSRPLIVLDGLPTEFDLRTLNPNDVAQITVLKDAAAASIWGVRAANGVIVIQTKKGKYNRQPTLTFGTSFTQAGKPRLGYLPLLNSSQFLNYEQELVSRGILTDPGLPSAANAGYYFPRAVTAGQELLFEAQRGTITAAQRDAGLQALAAQGRVGYDQLQQYLLQPAQSQTYDLSVSGGSDNSTYFLSASYARERPNAVGNNGSRLTLTATQEFKLFRTATVTAEAKGTFFRQSQGGLGLQPLTQSPTMLLPYNQLADASGNGLSYDYAYYTPKVRQLDSLGYLPYGYNYLRENSLQSNNVSENNYWGSLNVRVPLLPGLSANGLVSFERTFGEQDLYNAPDSYYTRNLINQATTYDPVAGQLVYGIPMGAIYSTNLFGRNNYTVRGQLTLDREFGGKHQVSAIAGSEIRQALQSSNAQTLFGYNDQAQSYGQVNYAQPYAALTGGSVQLNNANELVDRQYRFLSYFANGSYTLLNRYTASGSVRYDDYNNLGLDRRYRATPLYSVGLAWAINQENWLKSAAWLSNLRLRATYGLNGNIPVNATPYTAISLASSDPLTTQPFAFITAPANQTLRWEQTAVTNLGLDFGLVGSRLNGTVEVYYKRSTDLFIDYPTSSTYGYTILRRNAAELNGRGVDISLGGSPIRTGSWEWNITGVLSYNTNSLVNFQVDNTQNVVASGGTALLSNYPTDNLFVFRAAGLDNTGRQLVYGQNEKVVDSFTPLTSLDDLHYAGRTTPSWTGGLNQTLRYKGLSLYVQVVGKFDYVFLPPTLGVTPSARRFFGYDLNADVDRRWRQPGDEATTSVVGLLGATGNSYIRYFNSDQRVQRGDHARLREVSLRYTLPAELLGHVGFVKGVNLGVAARNIGLLWRRNSLGIDPDFLPNTQQLSLPPAVSYVFSLNANF